MKSISKLRRLARTLAVDVLYQAEIRDQLPTEALTLMRRQGWSVTLADAGVGDPDDSPPDDAVGYAETLIVGIQEHASEIDILIDRYADHWTISRMPVVDRSILRLAIYELLWEPEVPTPVAINEAVEVAQELSTEASGRFINGILGRLAADRLDRT